MSATSTATGVTSISVIMPVYNGAATLRQSLAPLAVMQRDGEIVELIVVDDGSTDASRAIAEEFGARVLPSGGRLGPGGARNVAATHARGDVLWFVDADVVVHDDAARVLAGTLRRTGAAAVFGTYDDRPPAANFFSQYKNLVHHHYHRQAEGEAETFWAGCGAVRKEQFLAVGGFDLVRYPKPSIEDIELGLRLRDRGYRIWLTPELQGTHLKVWLFGNLLHTEVFCRALPWSRLIHARAERLDSLNVSRAERLRALLAFGFVASVAAAVGALVPAWAPLLALALAVLANRALFALFARRRGVLFALGAILYHQFYYLYGSAVFVGCALEHRWLTLRGGGTRH